MSWKQLRNWFNRTHFSFKPFLTSFMVYNCVNTCKLAGVSYPLDDTPRSNEFVGDLSIMHNKFQLCCKLTDYVVIGLYPCSSNPCRNGSCSQSDDGYTCNCTTGYSGRNCDKGKTPTFGDLFNSVKGKSMD